MALEPIDEVRRASDLTMDYMTARVAWSVQTGWRGWSMIADIFHPDHFSPPVGRTARSVWLGAGSVARGVDRGVSKLMSAEGDGAADFQTGGCLLTGRKLGLAFDLYLRPGSSTLRQRRGGSWREMREQSAQGSVEYTPIWLVELPRGVTEATLRGHETVDETLCRRLTARCDPSLAAERSRHRMKLPDFGRPEADMPELFEDQRSVPTDLWLDNSGCLRRIRTTFRIGEPDEVIKETSGFKADLSLRDLGTAPAPVPPPTAAVAARAGRDRAVTQPSP
jgi:hypothetical protein